MHLNYLKRKHSYDHNVIASVAGVEGEGNGGQENEKMAGSWEGEGIRCTELVGYNQTHDSFQSPLPYPISGQ